jgi:quinoprotein glucose dehydrogenase
VTPLRISVLFIAAALALSPQGGAPSRQPSLQVEWPYYGGDAGNSKYSPLTDVNSGNIQRLQIAWQWKHWEAPLPEYGTAPGFFENTPLMIDGVLYVTTPYNSMCPTLITLRASSCQVRNVYSPCN